MKRGNAAIKIVAAMFFLTVLSYIGIYLYRALDDPFQTTAALAYNVFDGASINGIIIRDEIVLEAEYDIVFVSAEEGKRVATGNEIAVAYIRAEDMERASKIREVRAQIVRLESIRDSSTQDTDPIKLDMQIRKDIMKLRYAAASRDLLTIEDVSAGLLALSYSENRETDDLNERLSALYNELIQLGEISGSARITAPASGIFTRVVDGFEDVGTDVLEQLNPDYLIELMNSGYETSDSAIGKLVCGSKWYFVANVPSDEAKKLNSLHEDDEVSGAEILFGKYYREKLYMTVESIGVEENGICTVVFSCNTAMADTLAMRIQSAELIRKEYNGIRVPKKAIHLTENNEPCVYVITGLQAELKTVKIIYETVDFYIVEKEIERERSLRVGDMIIVSAKDLYDGKVIG